MFNFQRKILSVCNSYTERAFVYVIFGFHKCILTTENVAVKGKLEKKKKLLYYRIFKAFMN